MSVFRRICVLTVFWAVGSSSVLGQARTDQRLDNKLNRRVIQNEGPGKESFKKGLDLSLVSSLAYDNNIFQTPDNETRSVVAQFEPTVGWTAGSRDGTWVRLAYEGAAILYLSRSEDNRIDNRVTAEGEVKGKDLSLAYSAGWAKLGSPSADTGGASDRFEYGGTAELTYTPKGKVSYSLSVEQAVVDQEESGFFDFYQSSVGVSANYRHSRKTELEAAYRFGQADVDGSGKQDFHRVGLQALWRPRPKISFSVEAGVEHRNYEVGSGTDPFLAARVDWTPREKTAFYLQAYRREEASAGVEGENFEVTGFRAGVTQQLRDGWSIGFEVGRETADYFGIAGLPESGREDTMTFVRPSLRYVFGEDSEFVALYQWSESDSTDPGFGFNNQQLSFSMNYHF